MPQMQSNLTSKKERTAFTYKYLQEHQLWALKQCSLGKLWALSHQLLDQEQSVLEDNLALTQRLGSDLIGRGHRNEWNYDLPRRAPAWLCASWSADRPVSSKKEKSRLDLWKMVKSCFLPRGKRKKKKKKGIKGLKSTLDNSASFVYLLSNSNSPMWFLLP